MEEIKRRNEILVERLCKVKPVVNSQDRPEKFTHIKSNGKKRWINYSKSTQLTSHLSNRIPSSTLKSVCLSVSLTHS